MVAQVYSVVASHEISYSCIRNVKQIIDGHNKALLHKQEGNSQQERTCNCRIREQCPLDGKCLNSAVIYQAAVTANDNMHQETYIGLTKTYFKARYNNHKVTFRNEAKKLHLESSKQQKKFQHKMEDIKEISAIQQFTQDL